MKKKNHWKLPSILLEDKGGVKCEYGTVFFKVGFVDLLENPTQVHLSNAQQSQSTDTEL